MTKQILLLGLITFLCINSYSQVLFENGYFINESNQKIECLIKNMDWKKNPTEFEYKLSQEGAILEAEIDSVKEFGINNVSKFIRADVKIDKSSNNIYELNSDRSPIFHEEQLFLKVLIEGKFSLYLYTQRNLIRFFYKTDDSEVKQLVYKSYLVNDKVAYNNEFKQQLINITSGYPEIKIKNIESVGYNKKELKQFFSKANEYLNLGSIDYSSKKYKDLFHLTIRPGLNISSLEVENVDPLYGYFDFGTAYFPRFGIEAEFFLPFNKNKWSIVVEPTYQYYSGELTKEANVLVGGLLIAKCNYQAIDLPISIRHHFYLTENSKIHVNISAVFDHSLNSHIEFSRDTGSLMKNTDLNSNINLAYGLGFKYKNKYGFEVRYLTRNILADYVHWTSNYNTLSIIFGYTLF